MNITMEELKELLNFTTTVSKGLEKIKDKSITLRVIADDINNLKHPIELEGIQQAPIKIKQLGIYEMEGIKVWVVKK